jgi:hypothetical protein
MISPIRTYRVVSGAAVWEYYRGKMIPILLILLTMMSAQQQSRPNTDFGVIRGIVIDPDGKLVEGARVYLTADSYPPKSRPDATTTNAKGEFVLNQVIPGKKLAIHAYKDIDYFSDVVIGFNLPPKSELPEVEVKPGQTVTGITVRLMSKAGKIHLSVRDANTKDLVHGIFYQLCRADHPTEIGYCVTGSGPSDLDEFVPVGVGISIKVSAASHGQDSFQWQYHDPETGSPYFNAKSGETETMNIYVPKN